MERNTFEQFMLEHGKSIYSFCYHLTMNRDVADDLYQETMLKAFEEIDNIYENRNPESFIISIAIGKWRNIRKKEARRNKIIPIELFDELDEEQLESLENVEDTILQKEQSDILDRVFRKMEDKFKIPMILYYKEQMSLEEISRICKKPKGTIKSRLHKGRKIVKKELVKERYSYE